MTYAIATSSKTGNTRAIADAIAAALGQTCKYNGAPSAEALDADVIFAGFWTDKGSCAQDLADFLRQCGGKRVALFGTAGFGGDPAYFETLLGNVQKLLPADAVYLGGWMCQGKMPDGVRARFAAQLAQDPGNANAARMLDNFDRARSHPDADDLAAAADFARRIAAAI